MLLFDVLLQSLLSELSIFNCGWRAGSSCLSDADRHVGVLLQKHCKPFGFLQASVQKQWWQVEEKCFWGSTVNIPLFLGSPISVLSACQGCVVACPNMTALSTCHSSKSQKKSRACFHRTAVDTRRIVLPASAALRAVCCFPRKQELNSSAKGRMVCWVD